MISAVISWNSKYAVRVYSSTFSWTIWCVGTAPLKNKHCIFLLQTLSSQKLFLPLMNYCFPFICVCFIGVFRGNLAQVKEYQDLLDPVLQHTSEGIIWQLFFQITVLFYFSFYHKITDITEYCSQNYVPCKTQVLKYSIPGRQIAS